MKEISSGVAFWILEAWRKMNAQLHLVALRNAQPSSWPAKVWHTSPTDSSVWMVRLLDDGQNTEWMISLEGAKFSFGVEGELTPFHELTEGVFVSVLLVELPTGAKFIFGEQFFEDEESE
jgi:hypothetical protein